MLVGTCWGEGPTSDRFALTSAPEPVTTAAAVVVVAVGVGGVRRTGIGPRIRLARACASYGDMGEEGGRGGLSSVARRYRGEFSAGAGASDGAVAVVVGAALVVLAWTAVKVVAVVG